MKDCEDFNDSKRETDYLLKVELDDLPISGFLWEKKSTIVVVGFNKKGNHDKFKTKGQSYKINFVLKSPYNSQIHWWFNTYIFIIIILIFRM